MLPLLLSLILLIAAVDIRTLRVPDALVFPLGLMGIACYGVTHLPSALLLVLFGYLAHFLPTTPYLGRGDIKLMGALGLFIPLASLDTFCLLSGTLGILWGVTFPWARGQRFPFAPALSVAFLILILSLASHPFSGHIPS